MLLTVDTELLTVVIFVAFVTPELLTVLKLLLVVTRELLTVVIFVAFVTPELLTVLKLLLVVTRELLTVVNADVTGRFVSIEPSPTKRPKTVPAEIVEKKPYEVDIVTAEILDTARR